jgi:hypothetical protein
VHNFKKAKADESAARSGRSMLLLFPLYFLVKRSGLVYLKNQQDEIKTLVWLCDKNKNSLIQPKAEVKFIAERSYRPLYQISLLIYF